MMAFKHCYLFYCWYLLIAGGVLRALSSSLCGEHDPLFEQEFMNNLLRIRQQLNPPGCNPPKNRSCQEILYCFPSSSSGYHQIHAPNGSLIQVYCDMEGTNCGDVSGWTRVAFVNMTQPGFICPHSLTPQTFSGLTLCSRSAGTITCQGQV